MNEDPQPPPSLSPNAVRAINGAVWLVCSAGELTWHATRFVMRSIAGTLLAVPGALAVHGAAVTLKIHGYCEAANGALSRLLSFWC